MSANKILPFRFWCQKVLPLIYDDSLSYLEVLCKITAKLNELIESDNSQSDAIQELQTAVQELIEQESQVEEQIAELGNRMTSAENDILIINSSIEGIAHSVDDIRTKLFTLTNNFASDYADDVYYNAGQYCIYNYRLYRCVEDIPNPSGDFDPSKWTSTNTGVEFVRLWDECANIRTAFDALVVNVMGNLALPFFNYEGETVSYVEGDLVTDYQWLYKCIQGYSFDSVVPTPANDRVHWQQTTIAENLSSGGGGGGGSESVPVYDPSESYARYDFVSYNDTVYMCKSVAAGGTFDPNDWVSMDTFTLTSGNARILMTDYGEYYGDADKGLLVAYRDPSTNKYFLYRCTDDTSGTFDPDNFVMTDLITELNMESYLTCNRRIDTYDSTATYNAGNIMIYGGMMYKCIVDGTTGDYDFHNWEDTNMFKELASVKNTLINLNLYNGNVVDRYNTNVTEVI